MNERNLESSMKPLPNPQRMSNSGFNSVNEESLNSTKLDSGDQNMEINGSLASYGMNTYQNKLLSNKSPK